MIRGGNSSGFTLVESLIVLAVTALMFVSIATIIGGKTSKVEFQTSINSMRQQIQQVINETQSGYFPDTGGYTCTAVSSASPPTISAGSSEQGTNTGCVFLGKVMQFSTDSSLKTSSDFKYAVWPIVGNQNPGTTAEQKVGVNVFPTPLKPAQTSKALSFGLAPVKMTFDGIPTAGVGFLAGNNQGVIAAGGSNGLASGSQTMSLYGIRNTTLTTSLASMESALKTPVTNYQNAAKVEICFESGSTNQSGLITIGKDNASGANRALTVTLKIHNGKTCS